jgi:CheY-like chemotaxis protein
MEEDKSLLNDVASDIYDASDRPFDFVEADVQTALVCETDPGIRDKVSAALKELGFHITESASARDALKKMRFHVYDLVILNENFDTRDPDANDVLAYLENLAMGTRRYIFVALLSGRYRTMDNMAAFNRSVNIVINPKSLDDAGAIFKRGIADSASFYRVFNEAMRRTGKA